MSRRGKTEDKQPFHQTVLNRYFIDKHTNEDANSILKKRKLATNIDQKENSENVNQITNPIAIRTRRKSNNKTHIPIEYDQEQSKLSKSESDVVNKALIKPDVLEPNIELVNPNKEEIVSKVLELEKEVNKNGSTKKNKYTKVNEIRPKRDPPPNWEELWDGISKMRSEKVAPVDTMGCEDLADGDSDPKIFRYQTLISLLLSSQTKDPVTAEAMRNLKIHGLTVQNMLDTEEATIDKLIKKVGFHARKASYIKQTSKILHDKYDDDIPETLEGLLELPGIGPKMAFLILQVAWKNSIGIGVDVHVHRISNRLKWVHNTKTPEDTRKELESWLPRDKWGPINKLLVGFGQTICTPVHPKCKTCKVNHLCPSAFKV